MEMSSWYDNPDESPGKRYFGRNIDVNSGPVPENDDLSEQPIAKRRNQQPVKNGAKRRAEGENMDNLFIKGHQDDMHRIRKALEKYESGDGAFNTVAGLLVKLPDDEDEQERMFTWCHSMGFAQADDTHPVMKLKGPKLGELQQSVNRCKRDPSSVMFCSSETFLGSSAAPSDVPKKAARKNARPKPPRKEQSKEKRNRKKSVDMPSAGKTILTLDNLREARRRSQSAPDLEAFARLSGAGKPFGDQYRINTQLSDDLLSDASTSPRANCSSRCSNKRSFESPSPDIIEEGEAEHDGAADTVTREFNSIAIESANKKDEDAMSCALVAPASQLKRSRIEKEEHPYALFNGPQVVSHGAGTPLVSDACGSSVFSPPSSGALPPPVPFEDCMSSFSTAAPQIRRGKSCSELFGEEAPISSSSSSHLTSDSREPSSGDSTRGIFSRWAFDSSSACPANRISGAERMEESNDGDDNGHHHRHNTQRDVHRESDGSARGSMGGYKIRRQMTEPYLNPNTPFRDAGRSLSQDDVIYTPQPVFLRNRACGTGEHDWGVSQVAPENTLFPFQVVFQRVENAPTVIERPVNMLKSNAKAKKRQAFLRRMSHNRSGMMSPAGSVCKKIKVPFKSTPELHSPLVEAEDDWSLVDNLCGSKTYGTVDEHSVEPVIASTSNAINELTFNGVIVGGVYENCFDDNVPVVSAPSSYDNRVANVSFEANGSLALHIFSPSSKRIKIVNLGNAWVCYKTSTGAFLVSKTEIVPHRRMVCYYLPKHPLRWAGSSKGVNDYSIDSIVACDDHENASFIFQGNRSMCEASDMEDVESDCHSDGMVEDDHLCRVLITSMDMSAEIVRTESGVHLPVVESGMDSSMENSLVLPCSRRLIDSDCSCDDSEVLESSLVDWNNPVVILYVSDYLDYDDCVAFSSVSKAWALEYFKSRARRLSLPGNCDNLGKARWMRFMTRYSHGSYLSEGACKTVYRVCSTEESTSGNAYSAVSVMDIEDLIERGVEESISRELEISMVTSSLVSLNVSPNFIQLYSVFTSEYPPSANIWTSENGGGGISVTPRKISSVLEKDTKQIKKGNFQYIRMELCNGGDLEEVVRTRSVLSSDEICNFFFQMCFSLYACRERLSMRHYDIKLLNFFCSSSSSLFFGDSSIQPDRMRIGFGDHIFSLPLSEATQGQTDVVKLADFGTSAIGSRSLGCPIGIHQFTTLENTPPEYLMLGSHAREAFTADTFCLGLSFFHLLSGEEPYEEHLKSIKCPIYLRKKLSKVWMTRDPSSPYCVIREVIESLDSSDESPEVQDSIENVLYDTLYRYVVLFGLCETSSVNSSGVEEISHPYSLENPIWLAIVDSLSPNPLSGKNTKSRSDCVKQFQSERDLWYLETGNHPVICRVRENLNLCGVSAMDILLSMVHLDPAQRCSLHDILESSLFSGLKNMEFLEKAHSVDYMYYKTTHQNGGGFDTLPIL